MKNRFLIAAVLILAATSCAKDRRPQPPMGWTAQDAVDRICGVYRLDSVEWTGQPVDLDGDGYAASLMEELLGGQCLGIQADCEATVHPATKLDTPTDAPVRVYFGDFLENGNGGLGLVCIRTATELPIVTWECHYTIYNYTNPEVTILQ